MRRDRPDDGPLDWAEVGGILACVGLTIVGLALVAVAAGCC